ncbi:hypothetical protein BC939DRAFT_200843 [Gamsiella multidivaricata]|uniref:uncharacterized protein n=1 Tax=Gamsiella multidivaricata TaxID=101098 RepID=UPI00221F6304|nr:uncharacterized protein BC939DRAFT_200843 [Gamsiella multidivaricata]KAI7821958.1 hypothetical protein BC939DRAFT_200843 [Gamsiella multidivaricata]
MLSEAMSKARVSETSGAPLAHSNIQDDTSSTSDAMAHPSQDPQQLDPVVSGIKGQNEDSGLKNEIPSFLMAIISRKDNKPLGPVEGSPALRQQNLKDMGSTQSMLLNSLTGAGKPSAGAEHRDSVRSNGPPLSAELLPASVMPSGLYSSSYRPNGANAAQGLQQPNHHASPSSTMAAATLLNRPNGAPNHGSPMQAPAFTYSPGMMPSPLVMPPIPGGPMMRPPAPPPMPFQHHPGLAGGPHHPMGPPSMGMPPPPPPPSAMAGSSFPADAMHAAMGAVGFMQQQQRGFVGHGNDVLSKADFSQQFMGLIQNDPQFMDVLYSNYTAVLARRG